MNLKEKNLFEEELKTQKPLRSELRLQQEIDQAIVKEMKISSFRDKLNGIHENNFRSKESKILNIQNKWYWAAASITLFSGTAIYSLKHHFQSPDYLYSSYYQVWQPSVITRGLESEQNIQKIIKEFEKGNFTKVIETFNTKIIDKQLNPKLILLKGCAEMELNNFDAAIETFAVFDSKDYTLYTEAGQWYQALCYLKNEDIDLAKQALTLIVERKTSYANEAEELLNKLK